MASPAPASKERTRVSVRVPATTANLGPGFDCLGMALDIWNELTVERADEFKVEIEGEAESKLPRDETNLVVVGCKAAFQAAGKEFPTLRFHCKNRIPFAGGMGSSSAAIVAGIVAGLVLSGHEVSVQGEEELLQIATSIEGHPDNVAPAIYGGLQIGLHNGKRWYTSRARVPHGLQCVLFSPDFQSETKAARAILSPEISRKDAIFNLGRVALIINALASGRLEELSMGMDDKLHQPQRAAINPHLFPLIEAAKKAGAHGVALSGAGPAVIAITSGASGDIYSQRKAERSECLVADAMIEAAKQVGVTGRAFITHPTEFGAHVISADPPFSDGHVTRFSSALGNTV
eukprot:TRINITY_DN54945_c0_g1_i1.p1 TRINITY_DN54945_c0_g1~~TRINITY_DN54945_c0_g1_i1.p1  ORF type:complete len:354 (+),score=50.85 TRINITY_DN54945_c0_g1_i1:22-1062(+)